MASTVPPGRSLSALIPRHFVPGYYLPVPPGQKPFAHRSADVDGVGYSTPHGPREVHIPNSHAALFHMLLIRR